MGFPPGMEVVSFEIAGGMKYLLSIGNSNRRIITMILTPFP